MAALRTFEDVLDVVHDEISIQIGFCEMMRLAQTSKALMSSVCSRVIEFDFTDPLEDREPFALRKCQMPHDQVVPLVRRCAGIRHVRLSPFFCEEPDDVILALTKYCKSLRSLDV